MDYTVNHLLSVCIRNLVSIFTTAIIYRETNTNVSTILEAFDAAENVICYFREQVRRALEK